MLSHTKDCNKGVHNSSARAQHQEYCEPEFSSSVSLSNPMYIVIVVSQQQQQFLCKA